MPETKLFSILKIEDPLCEPALEEAAAILARGGLVAIPTETVYGLAANACNPAAVRAIFAAKGRPQDNPLIVHIAELSALKDVAASVPEAALRLAEAFWPGPLTIILQKGERIPDETSAGLNTVAVRLPSHPVARELIRRAGVPVAAPSANRSGSPSTTTAAHCMRDLNGRVDAIVDGGPCSVGVESTVVTLAEGTPRLLRPGFVTPQELRAVLGELIVDPAVTGQLAPGARAASPGMKYKHYAPQCEVTLLSGTPERFAAYVNGHCAPGVLALCCDEDAPLLQCDTIVLGPRENACAQAARLFGALREADDRGAVTVYAPCPGRDGVELAIYNRLVRAAAFRVVEL